MNLFARHGILLVLYTKEGWLATVPSPCLFTHVHRDISISVITCRKISVKLQNSISIIFFG